MDELKPKRQGNYRHSGNPKHGLYPENVLLYNTWQTMIGRCENPNRPKYKDYCGRGIKVCKEWHTAKNFILWALNNGYNPGLQIDRIDNNGNYCPENCRFATPKENSRNRRNTRIMRDLMKEGYPITEYRIKCCSWTEKETWHPIFKIGERREGE